MKRLYWRPQKVSLTALLLIAVFSVLGMAVVELCPKKTPQPCYQEKLAAATLAQRGMNLLREERLRRGHPIDPTIDPTGSGLIGPEISSVTSIGGHLPSKQATINPNFAAVAVDMLRQAGVERGDVVAVGYTGSLPALNLAVCAALETLGARPIIISSTLSSQYGANLPDFLWLDMERALHEKGCISFRSVAASLGGFEDRGLGLDQSQSDGIRETIRRGGLELIEAETYAQSLEARMRIYERHAAGRPIMAYINVGGGTVSVGRALGRKLFPSGVTVEPPANALHHDSVMGRFAEQGVPLINFTLIRNMARRYGLEVAPNRMPEVGAGPVYVHCQYNRWLAGGVLLAILVGLRAFVLTDLGVRLGRMTRSDRDASPLSPHAPRQEKREDSGAELMV